MYLSPSLPVSLYPLSLTRSHSPNMCSLPIMRQLSTFASPKGGVVLIGDARATVTPSLGQVRDCRNLPQNLLCLFSVKPCLSGNDALTGPGERWGPTYLLGICDPVLNAGVDMRHQRLYSQ
jgi:hypothetical protein